MTVLSVNLSPQLLLHPELPHLTNSRHSQSEDNFTPELFEISETLFYVNIGCALNTLAHFQSPCRIIHIKWIIDEENDHSPHTHSSQSLNLEAFYFSAAYVPLRISYFGVAGGPRGCQRTHRDSSLPFEVFTPVNLAGNVQALIDPGVYSSSVMLKTYRKYWIQLKSNSSV